jgi:hypothetical protein
MRKGGRTGFRCQVRGAGIIVDRLHCPQIARQAKPSQVRSIRLAMANLGGQCPDCESHELLAERLLAKYVLEKVLRSDASDL